MKKGIIYLLITALAWSWPNVMIRMLKADFDVFTQSFFRYVGASIFLFAIGIIFTRKKIMDAAFNLKILLIPALIMAAHQIFFTAGIFMTSAVVSSLIGRLNAVIIPTLSYIIYSDERQVVGNKNFIFGSSIAMIGVIGVILGRNVEITDGFNVGVVFVMLGTLCWSIYAVYIKKLVRSIDPLAIISFVSLLSIVLFLPLVLMFGNIRKVVYVSTGTQILLFGSGILGVGIGNVFYYHAIKHVGTSISSVFFLLLPFSVGIIGFLVLGETLTVIQIIAGALSIFGCWIVTRLKKKIPPSIETQPGGLDTAKSRI